MLPGRHVTRRAKSYSARCRCGDAALKRVCQRLSAAPQRKNFSADANRCTQNTQMATESRLRLWLNVGNARPSFESVAHGLRAERKHLRVLRASVCICAEFFSVPRRQSFACEPPPLRDLSIISYVVGPGKG